MTNALFIYRDGRKGDPESHDADASDVGDSRFPRRALL
jgi:hypothetical protein